MLQKHLYGIVKSNLYGGRIFRCGLEQNGSECSAAGTSSRGMRDSELNTESYRDRMREMHKSLRPVKLTVPGEEKNKTFYNTCENSFIRCPAITDIYQ